MCGLVGVVSKTPIEDRGWLSKAGNGLNHRGPDDAGEWWSQDSRVGLAHRRLAIVDLSPLGHQPMHYSERGLTIVFNGEIYNYVELRLKLKSLGHTFYSETDTEVLLHAYSEWGTSCIERMNGMFSFAIYDSAKQLVFIARDRAGEKPLFYRLDEGRLFFSSELKGLLANPLLPRRINFDALNCYLSMGYVPGHRCILDGYNKLRPGHAMIFDLSEGILNIWCYWKLPDFQYRLEDSCEAVLLQKLENLLDDSVGKQLVADVPVGVMLSGGLDSSLVTAMAVRHSDHVNTFSIGFPGSSKLDETAHARLIAKHFGTKHTELMADYSSASLLPELARQFDEPIIDSSMIPTWMVSNLVHQHCKVALGGDGGDELFGGYNHYARLLWMQRNLQFIPLAIRTLIANSAELYMPVGLKGRNYCMGINFDFSSGLPLIANYFDNATRQSLIGNLSENYLLSNSIRQASIPKEPDLLQRATRMDFINYLPEDILVKVDRASMLNSLEVRSPFLDYRLIEFAFGAVPSNLKTTILDKKILLKKLADKILPKNFDKNRKQGFSIPLDNWLKSGPYRELFWETLTSKDCIFDLKTVKKLFKNQDKGYKNGERIFGLVQFELWRKTYSVSF
jgi:asparagine synthase (glutamine-hydrolysing)